MKKATMILVAVLVIMLTAGSALARTGSSSSSRKTGDAPLSRAGRVLRQEKRFGEGLVPTAQKVRQNSLMIRELHLQLQKNLKELRTALQETEEANLTAEQITGLREGFRLIRTNRMSLGATFGEVHGEMLRLRANRLNQDLDGCKQNLSNVIAIQENRITLLTKLLADTQSLLKDLQ